MPGSLLDDGPPAIGALPRGLGGDEEARRAQRLREQAMQACVYVMAQDRLKRARLGRTRPQRPSYEPGQRVYFWRRRGLRTRSATAYWQGPAVVIQHEGRNAVWLAFGNYCIQACPEHLRPLADEEELGIKHVPEELREMKHNLETIPAHDFWDITKEEKPPDDEDDFSDVEDDREERRSVDSGEENAEEMPRAVPAAPEGEDPQVAVESTAIAPVANRGTEREDEYRSEFFRELADRGEKSKEKKVRRQAQDDVPSEALIPFSSVLVKNALSNWPWRTIQKTRRTNEESHAKAEHRRRQQFGMASEIGQTDQDPHGDL